MDLVLMVSLNGLKNEEIINTKIGRRNNPDSQPVSLNETIKWYSEFSVGDSGFRRIDQTSTVGSEVDKGTKWAREVWKNESYGIRYYVVTEDQAKSLIATKPYSSEEVD
jgi:hypothetical protein